MKTVAVIGLGYWGKNLVRNFSELGCLHAICDISSDRIKVYQEKYDVGITFDDYHSVLTDETVDAVVIATPAVTHYELVKNALLAGKDVFVEKPLALRLTEAIELKELARERQAVLMIDHILQYHPAIIKLKSLITEGALGKLQYIYSNRLNIGKLRSEENILWSFAPHDISVILSLVNKPAIDVSAFGGAYLQDNTYDTTITNITFSERSKAHIFVSWLHPFKEQKLVVIGSESMAVFDDMEEDNKLTLYPHKVKWINQVPIADKAERVTIEIEKKEPLQEACRHFLDCLESRKEPQTGADEAIAVLDVLEKAQGYLDKGNA